MLTLMKGLSSRSCSCTAIKCEAKKSALYLASTSSYLQLTRLKSILLDFCQMECNSTSSGRKKYTQTEIKRHCGLTVMSPVCRFTQPISDSRVR